MNKILLFFLFPVAVFSQVITGSSFQFSPQSNLSIYARTDSNGETMSNDNGNGMTFCAFKKSITHSGEFIAEFEPETYKENGESIAYTSWQGWCLDSTLGREYGEQKLYLKVDGTGVWPFDLRADHNYMYIGSPDRDVWLWSVGNIYINPGDDGFTRIYSGTFVLPASHPPTSSDSPGITGSIDYSANYFFVCDSPNHWIRFPKDTSW